MFFTRRNKRTIRLAFKMIAMIISFAVTVLIFNFNMIRKIIKYARNYSHFRKIDYTFIKIQRMVLQMDGFQFEVFCKELYKALGYKVKRTPPTCDYGRDLILNDKIFVECKHYTGNSQVGREICQKLIGSMEAFNISEGIVITTGKVHSNAYEYASRLKHKHLQLVTLNDIMHMISKIEASKIPHIMECAFAPQDEELLNSMEKLAVDLENR